MYGEDKDYEEVFFKDTRNRKDTWGKKRFNAKDVKHRMDQIEKRNNQAQGITKEEEEEEW